MGRQDSHKALAGTLADNSLLGEPGDVEAMVEVGCWASCSGRGSVCQGEHQLDWAKVVVGN